MNTPDAETHQRLARAQALMQAQGIDALLLLTGPNLIYLTGMPCGRSGSRPFVAVIPAQGAPTLIVHEGRQFEARSLTGLEDIRTYAELSHLPVPVIVDALASHGLAAARIGAELGQEMVMDATYSDFSALQAACPGITWVDASPLLWKLRMIKSEQETARVAQACRITTEAYALTFGAVQPGMTEGEIQQMMLCNMLRLGGADPWVLITSGPGRYDLVSKGASPRSVQPGDMIWMDCGCAFEGYFADFGRAGVLGGQTTLQRLAQQAIYEITMQAAALMRPGTPAAEIARWCSQALAGLGLPITSDISGLAGRVGHGLGLLVTEQPSLGEDCLTVLEEGMILTIEPGVATEYGTFHIEQNVLVTSEGPRILTEGQWQLWDL